MEEKKNAGGESGSLYDIWTPLQTRVSGMRGQGKRDFPVISNNVRFHTVGRNLFPTTECSVSILRTKA